MSEQNAGWSKPGVVWSGLLTFRSHRREVYRAHVVARITEPMVITVLEWEWKTAPPALNAELTCHIDATLAAAIRLALFRAIL